LSANTIYYLRAGALYNNGTTSYANTAPAFHPSTLTNLVSAARIYQVLPTIITVNWQS